MTEALSAADIAAFKRQQVEQASGEIDAVLKKFSVKLVAQPVLLPDGRLSAQIVLSYDEG